MKKILRFHLAATGNNSIGRHCDIEPNRYDYRYFAVFTMNRQQEGLPGIEMDRHRGSNGLLIHSIHNNAGTWLIGIGLIQMVVMFSGRQFRTSWLTA